MNIDLDPVTFEVLRHRLWSIHRELGATIKAMSGSPTASDGGDFNTAILDANGESLVIGVFVTMHAATQTSVIKSILAEYGNDFVREGDMFLTNDPYVGALHQSDVVLVAPVFVDGERVAWVGNAIHQIDVGGPVPGGFSVGAASIFDEPVPFPPVRVVEDGLIRPDIESGYVRRSRQPEMLRLDLRAQVGANLVGINRIQDVAQRFGKDTMIAAFSGMMTFAEERFRARLAELPRGEWSETVVIDHDGLEDRRYDVTIRIVNDGSVLTCDFTGSSPQAPGLINCTRPALEGSVLTGVLPLLCFDMPWSPGGVGRCLDIRSTPGTVCHSVWPAGVSSASIEASRAIAIATSTAIGQMLNDSDKYRYRSMAGWAGAHQTLTLFGQRIGGRPFGAVMTDASAGGSGACGSRDGTDSGGSITSLATSIPNVEATERSAPVLFFYRRERRDGGGAGQFRGGVGGECAYALYGTEGETSATLISHGVEVDPSSGIAGGRPSTRARASVVRNADAATLVRDGVLESQISSPLPAKARFILKEGDVFIQAYPGGSGYGDPHARSLDAVEVDVRDGVIDVDTANQEYGVLIDAAGRASRLDEDGA